MTPSATYRLQLHRGFGFAAAAELVPYLEQLGISHLYSSPILKARPGSMHGYDITDPTMLNPELGTPQEFDLLAGALAQRGMGLVVDTVPNHMAASAANPWWRDVLQEGRASRWARFFDIDWEPQRDLDRARIVLPLLGDPFGVVLERGELRLCHEESGFAVCYFDEAFPLSRRTWPAILALDEARLCDLAQRDAQASSALCNLIAGLAALPEPGAPSAPGPRAEPAASSEGMALHDLSCASPAVRALIERNLRELNGTPGEPRSFDRLERLLAHQRWQLVSWRAGRERASYRRFFDIGGLVGVRIEDPQVLEATHRLVLRLVEEGKIQGLRIDHVDGLRDPLRYLRCLQRTLPDADAAAADTQPDASAPHDTHMDAGAPHEAHAVTSAAAAARPFWVVVEKVLAQDEQLPAEWPVAGTSGYDFLSAVNGLYVDSRGFRALEAVYQEFAGAPLGSFDDLVHAGKLQVMQQLFAADMRRILRGVVRLAAKDRHALDLTAAELGAALAETTAALAVYRTYVRSRSIAERDRCCIEQALVAARRCRPDLEPRAFDFLGRLLLLDPSLADLDEALEAVMAWQQVTVPVTAKGVEDTVLYTSNRLVSLNDVGSAPAAAGIDVAAFHDFNLRRHAAWPSSMSTTSTHDTKRSEDVRARIDVIAEVPDAWRDHVLLWRRQNARWKRIVRGASVPEPNDEYLLYQTLLGVWPVQGGRADLSERIPAYLVKAAREAKAATSWLAPDVEYEQALRDFVGRILDPRWAPAFLADFIAFQDELAPHGALASLGQTLLKITSPGIPDFYQGTELWDQSLVDPDNRRPVDFARRRTLLAQLAALREVDLPATCSALLASWRDGRIKMLLTQRALACRRAWPELFVEGRYLPLEVRGSHARHLVAFAREHQGTWAIAVVPRLTRQLGVRLPLGAAWDDDVVVLPEQSPARWRCVLSGSVLEVSSAALHVRDALASFPLALLEPIPRKPA